MFTVVSKTAPAVTTNLVILVIGRIDPDLIFGNYLAKLAKRLVMVSLLNVKLVTAISRLQGLAGATRLPDVF